MLDRTLAPAYQTLQTVHIPRAETQRLDNGLLLHVINAGEQPLVRLECVYQAGTWYEPQRAVAQFTTKMLNEGTATRTSQQISEYVDQYGAFVELNHGADRATVAVYTLVKYLPEVLVLLSDLLQHSTFPAPELDNLKRITAQTLQVNLEKNTYVANATLRAKLFGESHAYGKSLRLEDISAVAPEGLREFYVRRIQGRPFDVFLAGKVTEKEVNFVNRSLGQLDFTLAQTGEDTSLTSPADEPSTVVEKPGSLQSTIRLGRRLFTRTHPDYPSLLVLNEVLGGYFGSRLMKNIREDKGFTYGISSSLVTFRHGGYWVIGTDVKRESTRATLEEIDREIDRLKTEIISEGELETVKNYMAGAFAGSLNTAFDVADRFKTVYFEGLPPDYYDHYIERIRAVSAPELQQLANQYLDKTDFREVVVGGIDE